MPRCRHGYFHVVNNDYTSWGMYAIGGSANPTINSQGNRFLAADNTSTKEVTKRIVNPDDGWRDWNWRSEGDLLLNGAYFIPSSGSAAASYAMASSLAAMSSSAVATLTLEAGVLYCREGFPYSLSPYEKYLVHTHHVILLGAYLSLALSTHAL